MSSILTIILYHLTDSLISESFPPQIGVDLPQFLLVFFPGIEPFFPQKPPHGFLFSAFSVAYLKGFIDPFRGYPLLCQKGTDLFPAL